MVITYVSTPLVRLSMTRSLLDFIRARTAFESSTLAQSHGSQLQSLDHKTEDKKRDSSCQPRGRSKSRQVYRQKQQLGKLDIAETVEHVNVHSLKEIENPNSMLQERPMGSHTKGNSLAMVPFVPPSLPNEISTQHVFLLGETSLENISTSSNAKLLHWQNSTVTGVKISLAGLL
ncbi:hypothetical protein QYF36_000203 [Acer negundo]|nr:hypothetical protein QYF36_000203 [Acer negundo]